jgi:2-C-methyl-D-erythritol 4-phosphate cytidylyltransferase
VNWLVHHNLTVKAWEQRLAADQEKVEADKKLVATGRERNSSKRALLEADKKTRQETVLQLEGGFREERGAWRRRKPSWPRGSGDTQA